VEEIPIIASLPQYQMEQVCHQILNHFQAHETPAQPNDHGQLHAPSNQWTDHCKRAASQPMACSHHSRLLRLHAPEAHLVATRLQECKLDVSQAHPMTVSLQQLTETPHIPS